jgi:hypothetical protein
MAMLKAAALEFGLLAGVWVVLDWKATLAALAMGTLCNYNRAKLNA